MRKRCRGTVPLRQQRPGVGRNTATRSQAQQVELLAALWDLLPSAVEAELIVTPEPTLRVGRVAAVLGDYGYEVRTGDTVIACDLDAKQAVDQLLERNR